jgi:hypothetical protein
VGESRFALTVPWYRLLRFAIWRWNVSGTRLFAFLLKGCPGFTDRGCGWLGLPLALLEDSPKGKSLSRMECPAETQILVAGLVSVKEGARGDGGPACLSPHTTRAKVRRLQQPLVAEREEPFSS